MPHTAVSPVRFEHLDGSPLGIGTATPRLSWQVTTDDPDWRQTSCELDCDGTVVRVDSAEQLLVPWPFTPLASRARRTVRVRVASGEGWTDWSEPATVEAGLLATEDWNARFISPATLGRIGDPAPLLSRTLTLRSGVGIASARLYATAHGVYAATLNGTRVGDEVLAPGWTSYANRLRYATHDVTELLRAGDNELSVLLGNGWYRGRLAWGEPGRALYGDRLALLAQLEVTYSDGSTETVVTDEQWSARNSSVLADDIYDGQRTDLRPVTTAAAQDTVEVVEAGLGRLVAAEGPPVRATETVPAVKVWTSPSGRTLIDFGQNLVGWVRLTTRPPRDATEVIVRHAEVLDEHGELGVRPLRTAEATDTYLLPTAGAASGNDGADEALVLEPSLTFHGFRYAEVTGLRGLAPADAEAVVVGTDLRRTGWFSCSDSDVDQFHQNVVWGMRGNFLDVPTDCPQRDERLGWTGDIQVFSPTAAFLFDTAGFLSSWLADLDADQHSDGAVPFVVPDVLRDESPTAAAWGDAATVVPRVLHQRYADTGVLRRQFDSMCAWTDAVAARTTDGVVAGGFQFGDWLDPDAPPDNPFAAKADPDVVATACLARSSGITAEAARLIGRDADAERYATLAERTRDAFIRHYVTSAGRVLSDAPTVYAMAIAWDLLPTAAQRAGAAERLADLVRSSGFRIATGFVGTPLITDALTATGHPDLAYRLLLERGCPSWLYPVTMGATTVWERWDSMLPDGTINPGQMTSFNHYALGAVADWLHRTLAGLAPAAPGYRHITIRPVPYPAFTHAEARHLTPYGEASAAWRRDGDRLTVEAVVPPGTTATVHLPGADPAQDPLEVRHGRHSWTVPVPTGREAEIATVRDLIDSPELWNDAVTLFTDHGLGAGPADIARRAARHLSIHPLDLPLHLGGKSAGSREAARRALAELLGPRARSR
ncbi:family 78 glycoside hydrolase catalytic domain [Streptomyces sp. WMMB 322]|uniref:family 78 glycoside hydrolase catalytic domain n=1 Tax=Streptomyces sp. WMMB 322 TaxID=1286821 RepID=UPI0006E125FD|nr:family 78 glycoside hydrolase catalytic domain [Streptomyces sp. WMMB 322]SCK34520.1 alpha-L-rhamnosidase [Streptomyces sp. WMMB 322]